MITEADDRYARLHRKRVNFARKMQITSMGMKEGWKSFGEAIDELDDLYRNLL